ncbi:serine hydrolase domain-containing protein [soil metagenome]
MNNQRLAAAIDPLLQRAVDSGAVPGVAVGVTTREGTIYAGGFGRRDLRRDDPMTPQTVCNVASITKSMVSFGVMQLVEKGKVDLDQPLGGVIPYLGQLKVLTGFGADGEPAYRDPAGPVTLRHLLTHTAGFGYDAWNADVRRYRALKQLSAGTLASLRMPLLFDPGTRWEYGIGLDWAGQVLEAVTGQRLEAYMQENLFRPLGMQATWRMSEAMRAELATVHRRGADGTLAPVDNGPQAEPEFESGGGGLRMSARDYLKFMQMFLNRGVGNGVRLRKEETIALMSRADTAPNNLMTTLIAANPAASNDGIFFPGLPKRHGLGFMVNEVAAPTGRSAGSLGWAGMANTYFWIDPARGIGGVYMTQIMPFLDYMSLPLFLDFEKAVYDTA